MTRSPRSMALAALAATLGGCVMNEPATVGRVCGGNAGCGPGAVCDPNRGICVAEPRPDADIGPLGDGTIPEGSAAETSPDAGPDLALEGAPPPPDGATDTLTDQALADQAPADQTTADLTTAACAPAPQARITEVALVTSPYVTLAPRGLLANADLAGHRLEILGDQAPPLDFSFPAVTIDALGTLRVVGGKAGTGEISAGSTLPLAASNASVAVLLYDAEDKLVDYVAIGGAALGLPSNVTFAGGPVAIPAAFKPADEHFVHQGNAGSCPSFTAADWGTGPRL